MMATSVIRVLSLMTLINSITSQAHSSGGRDMDAFNLTEKTAAEDTNFGKHDLFSSCQAFTLDPDEYVLFGNGTVYVEAYNKSYNSSFYYLDHNSGFVKVCIPGTEIEEQIAKQGGNVRYHIIFYHITRICLGISIVCLLIHLSVFCVVPSLRNLPGYSMASLCLSLLFFYLLFLIADIETIEESGAPCVAVAAISYFFILSAFMWMITMSFDVFRSLLKATGKLRLATRRFVHRRYICYCLFSWGIPLLFVTVALIIDHVEGFPEDYRPDFGNEICWFRGRKALLMFFAGPVYAVIGINILFFVSSAYIIYVNRMRTEEVAYRTALRKKFTLHYRLATIMGLTWIVGFANTTKSFWLLCIYIILSSLQGFFIFLACTCTSKVRTRIKQLLKIKDRKISTISTTATFQSYWTEEFTPQSKIFTISSKENGNLTKV